MAHGPNSTIFGNTRVAAAFRRVSQAVCLAILLFPAALSAEDVDIRPRPAQEKTALDSKSPPRPVSCEPFDSMEGKLRCVLR
jgi:hypothetical protein